MNPQLRMGDLTTPLRSLAGRADAGHRSWPATVPVVFGPASLLALSGDGGALLRSTDGWWAHGVVFVLAAIPWWEVLLVVPPAIGLGLNPIAVGVVAFLGNVLPVYLIVAVHGRVTSWLERRRDGSDEKARRSRRASRLFERYGLGGWRWRPRSSSGSTWRP